MSEKKERVIVYLHSTIEDEEERESHKITAKGELFQRKGMDVLRFSEESEEEGRVDHLITIYPNRVNVNRKGALQTNQQFILHKTTENKIELPQGNIHLEISTKELSHQWKSADQKGELILHYEALLNGEIKRNHQLTVSYYKEDHQ